MHFCSRRLLNLPFSLSSHVSTSAAWEAADFPDPAAYTTRLSPTHLAELEALAASVPAGTPIHTVALTPARRTLAPTLGPLLERTAAEVRAGRGFALLKGMPADTIDMYATCLRCWLAGLLLCGGAPAGIRPTNAAGHLIGHVADTGADPADPTTRLYATAAAQPWHNDSADTVALLCLGVAAAGGGSAWASSVAIAAALLREDPPAAALLAGRGIWFYDRRGEVPAGKAPFFEMPVFNHSADGSVKVNRSSNYSASAAARFPEAVPPLSAAQKAAVAKVEAMAASPRFMLACSLQPGDLQLLNNHTCLHTREAFADGPGGRRHLLRLWLSSPLDPPLPAVYGELYGSDALTPGERGGIRVDGLTLKAEDCYVPLSPGG